MYFIGFILSSIAVTAAFTSIYRTRRYLLLNVIAAAVVITVYFIFREMLFIFLPEGMLLDLLF